MEIGGHELIELNRLSKTGECRTRWMVAEPILNTSTTFQHQNPSLKLSKPNFDFESINQSCK
jgi:hypothetical protein